MAKVSLTSITPIKKVDPITVEINGQTVTVEQYLPINDKLAIVEKVLAQTIDDTGFLNPVRLQVYTELEILRAYTNISITDKMIADAAKTYDLLTLNGILDHIIRAIPKDEYDMVFDAIDESAKHTIDYLTSFVGMVKSATEDYDATKVNIDQMMDSLNDPTQVGLVKDILEKIG